uniref:Endonuclease/exonuclease/phosphatase domain-containing protein n=1 Tax=Branchiostoma floridae TaxID=7739 RepID=C3XY78_BRAFL|eukprot:XP_002610753.1 hypothetical protein BRAFLDRAFT_91539 [Branchiostoma floridae]
MKFSYSTASKAKDRPGNVKASNASIESSSYDIRPKNGLATPNNTFIMSTLNCRTLAHKSPKAELNKLMSDVKISAVCIQEHRVMHKSEDPDIIAHDLGTNTLFTTSALKNAANATIGGVGIAVCSSLLPLVTSVEKISDRIVVMSIRGNPKTILVSCHSPHSDRPECEVEEFYSTLNSFVQSTPLHAMLLIGGDFNARIDGKFSFHQIPNRNGGYLLDLVNRNNLIVGNTSFQKPKNRLWTWRSPNGNLAQIDFCLFRKRWRNSIKDCQAFNSSNPIGSDHRMVSTKIRLSVRKPKTMSCTKLYWRALREDHELASTIDDDIAHTYANLPDQQKSYSSFVEICNKVGSKRLPRKPPRDPDPVDTIQVSIARRATLRSSTKDVQTAQIQLKKTYDRCEEDRIIKTLQTFEASSAPEHLRAWKLVRELSGKRSGVIFIQGEDRLNTWKNHFSKLLNNDVPQSSSTGVPITPVFDTNYNISCDPFTQESATQEIGLLLNASKTMVMHINPPVDPQVLKASDGTVIEQVSDFKYLGSFSNTAYDVSHRIRLAWGASHSLRKLYNGLPRITRVIRDRRLALAGHVMRHDEMAGRVLLWRPDEKRRRGRPTLTLKRVIEEDVGLQDGDLLSVMRDRVVWKNFIASPDKDELN